MTTEANYTEEMTAALIEAYVANPTPETVETLAEKYGKTVASIRMKLVREKVYKTKTATNKAPRVKKMDIINQIEEILEIPGELDSLEKATANALMKVLEGLQQQG